MASVDRLPGAVWWVYLGALAVLIVIANGVAWLDGRAPLGTFELYRTSLPVYPVAVLALLHYLNRVARRALADFAPALDATDTEYRRFEYQLTTLPTRGTLVALALSVAFTAAFTAVAPNRTDLFSRPPLLFGVDVAIYVIVFGLVAVFVYHTLHQLRMVSAIHASARGVNVFQLTPLYAFSRLTARTGVSLLLLNYFSVVTDPATFVNPALIGLTLLASVGAVACFALPLTEMHDRIESEKQRLVAEANAQLQTAIRQVYRRADSKHLTGIDQLNQLMATLVTTREVLAKIRTWPWETRTLTGFASALLPAAAGLGLFIVEQVLVIRVR